MRMGTRSVRLYVPAGVGSGGGLVGVGVFVAVGVSVGGSVFVGVAVGPAVGVAVAVAVLVAVANGVGDSVAVETMGGNRVSVGAGSVGVSVSIGVADAVFPAAWLISSGLLVNRPSADSSRTIRNRKPTQPIPSILVLVRVVTPSIAP
jgi:hypothetical protein